MTADEARQLLRLFRLQAAAAPPTEFPTTSVMQFFKAMFLARSSRDLTLSAK